MATISFLATQANAQDLKIPKYSEALNSQANTNNARSITNGGSCDSSNANCTIANEQTIESTVSISNGGTLTIESGGKLIVNSGTATPSVKVPNGGSINIDNKGTISSQGNGIILESSNGTITGNINNSGIITTTGHAAINVNKNSTITNITNTGTLKGQNGLAMWNNSKVETFENSGIIEGTSNGINLGKGTIENFTNTGTIKGESSGIYLSSSTINNLNNSSYINGWYGIQLYQSTIETLNNSGTIRANRGIYVWNATIENLINSGTINAVGGGNTVAAIAVANNSNSKFSTITNLNNEGVINSDTHGIIIELGNKVETIKNSGTIEAKLNGITFFQENPNTQSEATIDIGEIILESNSILKGGNNGISVVMTTGGNTDINIEKLEVQKNAILEGTSNAGVYISGGKNINANIIVEGSILGGQAGIINEGIIGATGDGGITIKNGGTVASLNGIAGIVNQGSGSIKGDITVSGEGSSIAGGITNIGSGEISGNISISDGGSVDTITNDGSGQISGNITVGEGSSVGSITNSGEGNIGGSITVDSGASVDNITNSGNANLSGSITNNGNLGSIENSGSINGSITNNSGDLEIKNDGNLGGAVIAGGSGNTSISNGNNGNINGGITVNDGSKVEIDNQGTVGKDGNGNTITVGSGGSATIKDWVVKADENGNANTVTISGSGTTTVENITLDSENLDLSKDMNINNIFKGDGSGSINTNNTTIGTNDNSGVVTLDVDENGKVVTKTALANGMGAILSQTLINTFVMRSFFIDTVLDDAARMVGKHSRVVHNEHKNMKNFKVDEHYHGFVLPYYSYNKVKINTSGDYNGRISAGHTKGIIAGFHTLRDIGVLGAYIGTEKAQMSTGDYFNLDMQTVYAGLRYGNAFLIDDKKSVFVKAQVKASYSDNDLKRYLSQRTREADGSTNTYAYGASIGTGLNFYAKGTDRLITPALDFNYEGGITDSFDMIGSAALGHERYYQSKLNLFSTTASIKWLEQWNSKFATSLAGGARLNLNPDIDTEGVAYSIRASDEVSIPRTFQFIQSSLIFSLTKDIDISLNYNGTFSSHADSHTGYLQFDFIF